MKKIVVIGGGISGVTLIREIEDKNINEYEIILVEPKDYLEVPYGMLRALVDPNGYGRKVRRRISEIIKAKQIYAKAVELKPTSVQLDNGEEIEFDYCVVATGSGARGFDALKVREAQTLEKRVSQWIEYNKQLEGAQDIAIIGGGTVGVELAGEIAEAYPKKNVTLYHNNNRVLHVLSKGASKKAHKILSNLGVNIKLDVQGVVEEKDGHKYVVEPTGNKQRYDVVYQSFGNYLEPQFMQNHFGNYIDERKQIKVNDFLQVLGHQNIFVIGDMNNVPEIKLGTLAANQAKNAAINLIHLAQNEKMKKYKPFKYTLSFVTLGKHNGIGQLPLIRIDQLAALKQKNDLFVDKTLYR